MAGCYREVPITLSTWTKLMAFVLRILSDFKHCLSALDFPWFCNPVPLCLLASINFPSHPQPCPFLQLPLKIPDWISLLRGGAAKTRHLSLLPLRPFFRSVSFSACVQSLRVSPGRPRAKYSSPYVVALSGVFWAIRTGARTVNGEDRPIS